MSDLYNGMDAMKRSIRNKARKREKVDRLQRLAAFVLCMALFANTIPMDVLAAQGDASSQTDVLLLEENTQDSATSLGDTADGIFDGEADGEVMDSGSAPMNSKSYTNGRILPYGTASVSMSDPGLASGTMMAAPAAASGEQLSLDVAWPSGYNESNTTLSLSKGAMSFAITPTLSGSTVDNPILKITIPSCMHFTDYPRSGSFQSVSPQGNVLTYTLEPKTAGCRIEGIQAEIPDGFKVEDGVTYSIEVSYYDGTKFLNLEETRAFTTRLPIGSVTIGGKSEFSEVLQEDGGIHFVGPYSLSINAQNHAPYSAFQVTVPLPENARPYLGKTDALEDGQSRKLTSSDGWGAFTVTYDSQQNTLFFSDIESDDFLSGKVSFFSLEPQGNEFYLCFTDPEARTYKSPSLPRVNCTINGKEYTPRTSSSITQVTFIEPTEWTEVRPNDAGDKWEDILALRYGEFEYNTRPYIRGIYASPETHVVYDSLKMTVPLPEGAVPVFGAGDSFEPLKAGETYNINENDDDRKFQVTYLKGQTFSVEGDTEEHIADMLVYEIPSGNTFLRSGSQEFSFSGDKTLYLHFTIPDLQEADYKSVASPQIEVTRRNSTPEIIYPHNNGHYLTTVTAIAPPQDIEVLMSFFFNDKLPNSPKTGWSDTITLRSRQPMNYDTTKSYDRSICTQENFSSSFRYPLDWIRMTVLLPAEATPGFGNSAYFQSLENGVTYERESSDGKWKVTYQENYEYTIDSASHTAKALIYELDSSYSTAGILSSSDTSCKSHSFTFNGKRNGESLYLRFNDVAEPIIYRSTASPRLEYQIGGKSYVASDFSQTDSDTVVTFVNPNIEWSKLYPRFKISQTLSGYEANAILPESNKELYGYLHNTTGYPLKNILVSYIFDDGLNVDQLVFDPEGHGAPSSAKIVYTTRRNSAEQEKELNAADNTLTLEAGDAFLTARITYDSLNISSIDGAKVLTASVHNYEAKDETEPRLITAEILSADSDYGSGNPKTTSSYPLYLKTVFDYLNISSKTGPNPLWIEKNFADITPLTVTVTTARYNAAGTVRLEYPNLELYLRMPKGYMLTGYRPPSGGSYNVTDHVLEDGDTLYCLKYTDNLPHPGGDHVFSFRIGPDADISASSALLPKAIYAAIGGNSRFQFDRFQTKTETELGLDVNGDGDMEDSFLPCPGNQINLRKRPGIDLIFIGGYLSAEGQSEMDYNKTYRIASKGNYHFTIHNDPGSKDSISDGTVHIILPEKGDTFSYQGTHTAQYSVLLTGPVRLQGGFMEASSIRYSADGSNWLTEGEVEDYSCISHIRIETAGDHTLNAADRATVELPFSIDPGEGTINPGSKTFIAVEMEYLLKDEKLPAYAFSELTIMPATFSGTIFHDKNWNGKQDEDELTDNRFTLTLYSGAEAAGTPLQNMFPTNSSGNYNFQMSQPGTYTLHVNKDENEQYGDSDYFDEDGNYTFTIDRDSPTPASSNLNMGILTLDPSKLISPVYRVRPASPDGKEGWYTTLPQVTLVPRVSSPDVNTMFWHDGETAQKLTPDTFPSVTETGTYAFKAYNEMVSAAGAAPVRSDTASLDLKVDVDVPVIKDGFSFSIADESNINAAGNFLPFGNFFNRSVQITVTAEDVGSGIDSLYYTLPGGQMQSVKPDSDGYLRFNIPMDTAGKITYYVEDRAGNKSETIALKKENGSEWWEIEDRPPVWEPIVLTDINGSAGVLGADGNVWFAASVNASAQVIDEDSGLAHITSRINETPAAVLTLNGNGKQAAFPFTTTVETEGRILLQAEAEDNATNTAATQTTFGIDRTAPVIVLENKFLSMTQGEQLLVLASEEQLPALASEEQLSVTTPEEPLPALASKDIGALADDTPIATVLVRDTGSGVDPDSIRVMWQGQEIDFQVTPAPAEGGYRLTFPMVELAYTDSGDAYLISAKDYTGWSAELPITRYQEQIVYVAADTGSDVTGDGSRTYPVQTLEAALERVRPGGMIVLLENYNGTAYVNLDVTLDLNGKVLHSDVPGSAITVGPAGSLTIMDSNGLASAAEGFGRDPESEGEIFGGIPGDPAFTLEGGSLALTDGTIYCGYTGDGSVQVLDDARMMYLLTYLNGGGTGEAPGLHYIEEHTTDALKQNTFSREGYTFRGWLYEDQLYDPGQEILMPGRNIVTLAKWAKKDGVPEETAEETEENRTLDSVPKTGNGQNRQGGHSSTPHTDNRMELYIKVRKKEDEQNTEN